ncbi:MAG: pyruvate formate-lyase-activating protein [Spirochaetales bacterium]|nr:pyruvate formate-lyase-activating protein [Spirochaetales bacterium]
MRTVTGRIHSFETGGMVDGPGIRFVVFTQGCPLRCLYCHNPDTWKKTDGQEMTVGEVLDKAKSYKSYMDSSGGGITVTGGEPLMQPEFVGALLQEARKLGIHTAVDTSGFATAEARKAVLPYADLVLLDIKSIKPTIFKKVSGVEIDSTLAALEELRELNTPVWVRHVVVPGLTDNLEDAKELARVLSEYPNIEKVEILPFHKLGEFKWEELDQPYTLGDTEPPSREVIERIRDIFREKNIPVA